MNIPKSRDMKQ